MEADRVAAAGAYGDRIAAAYDELHAHMEPALAVEALAALASGGRVLELGVGTGRVALPLAERGLEVHGIDASEGMIARLRAKPGGDAIALTVGDFADVGAEGEFALVFVVFNTFFGLLSQEEQVRCFRNVAARLDRGGVFVIEAFVPDLGRYNERGEALRAAHRAEQLRFHLSHLDAVAQRISTKLLVIDDGQLAQYPVEIRYAWPSELDLMARLAGLRLRERWSDWRGAPFTSASGAHISVYERARE